MLRRQHAASCIYTHALETRLQIHVCVANIKPYLLATDTT